MKELLENQRQINDRIAGYTPAEKSIVEDSPKRRSTNATKKKSDKK